MTSPMVLRLQDRLLQLFGTPAEGRSTLVSAMLRRDAGEAVSYWLQLGVAIGMATLGLVLGSVAVIIGAMLVAPLMGPILGLAMGLASGSPFLVLRSAGRIAISIGLAVAGAVAITLLVPFHELNAEISARTSPTVLDLATACFCALAGVYATLRPGSETAATAAGTSIGISLVPPLCASGFGLGVRMGSVATGAALLFLTNMVAIVAVGTVAFLAAGFNRVDVIPLEREHLAAATRAPIARALAKRLGRLFESRGGPVFRFLMPFVLLAIVYVPLRRALDEVAWQVRARTAVTAAISSEPGQLIQSRVRIERHEIDVLVVLLGDTRAASLARAHLERSIRAASHVEPHVEVFAIPDAAAFAGLESTLLTSRPAETASAPVSPSPSESLDATRQQVRAAVSTVWPAAASGEPLATEIGTNESGPLRVRVLHLGAALSADAVETVRRSLASTLGREVELVDADVPAAPLTRKNGDPALVAAVAMGVRATIGVGQVGVCAAHPPEPERRANDHAPDVELARTLDDLLAMHPRVTVVRAKDWSVQFVRGECPALSGDGGIVDEKFDAGTPEASVVDASTSARD